MVSFLNPHHTKDNFLSFPLTNCDALCPCGEGIALFIFCSFDIVYRMQDKIATNCDALVDCDALALIRLLVKDCDALVDCDALNLPL